MVQVRVAFYPYTPNLAGAHAGRLARTPEGGRRRYPARSGSHRSGRSTRALSRPQEPTASNHGADWSLTCRSTTSTGSSSRQRTERHPKRARCAPSVAAGIDRGRVPFRCDASWQSPSTRVLTSSFTANRRTERRISRHGIRPGGRPRSRRRIP